MTEHLYQVGLVIAAVGHLIALAASIHGWLCAAFGTIVCAIVNAHDGYHILAGVQIAFAIGDVYLWYTGGGNDDFRRKRRKLMSAAKAKLKMAKAWRPPALAPIRPPVPVGAS